MDTSLNAATWAVVLATFVGPIAAVLVARWDEGRRAREARRWTLFITLMGMRGRYLEREYVRALNSVHAEFSQSPQILGALRAFLAHVELQIDNADWRLKYRELMSALLVEIGHVVGFRGTAIEVARNAYFPTQWQIQESNQEVINEYLVDLAKGHKVMLVRVLPPPTVPDSDGGTSGGKPPAS